MNPTQSKIMAEVRLQIPDLVDYDYGFLLFKLLPHGAILHVKSSRLVYKGKNKGQFIIEVKIFYDNERKRTF